jgi:hypothetical protein
MVEASPRGSERGTGPRGYSRRALLKATAGLALVMAGAAAAALRTRGYVLPAGRALVALSPWEFVVVQHAAYPARTTWTSPDSWTRGSAA